MFIKIQKKDSILFMMIGIMSVLFGIIVVSYAYFKISGIVQSDIERELENKKKIIEAHALSDRMIISFLNEQKYDSIEQYVLTDKDFSIIFHDGKSIEEQKESDEYCDSDVLCSILKDSKNIDKLQKKLDIYYVATQKFRNGSGSDYVSAIDMENMYLMRVSPVMYDIKAYKGIFLLILLMYVLIIFIIAFTYRYYYVIALKDKQEQLFDSLGQKGVNITNTIEYIGNPKEYMELLIQFAVESKKKIKLLQKRTDEKKYDEIKIIVHGLKSNAKALGFDKLADNAYIFEKKCTDDPQYVIQNIDNLITEWQNIVGCIKK